MKQNNFKIKLIIASCLFVAAIVLLVLVLRESFLTISISPANSTVTIDNTILNLNATGKVQAILSPGNHVLNAESDGYDGYIKNFSLKDGSFKTISINLNKTGKIATIENGGQFLSISPDGESILYLSGDGKTLYKADLKLDDKGNVQTNTRAMTDSKLSGIDEITWSPNLDLALFRKAGGIDVFDFQKYDFVHQTETLWGQNIGSISWAPDNSDIAFVDTANNLLDFSNISHGDQRVILNFSNYGISNPILHWSQNSQYLLVISRNSDYSQNKIYTYNTFTNQMNEVTDIGDQVDAVFSPDNKKILYTSYSKTLDNSNSSVLSVMNLDGSSKQSLDIRTTTDKVAWKKDGVNFLVESLNADKNQEEISSFNTSISKIDGFYKTLSSGIPSLVKLLDDDKIIVYQTSQGIFAVKK
jgi:hypothetical protein